MTRITILDGYIDEPTCLGVPPYISPYPRYIAGSIWCVDKSIDVAYITIDQIRRDRKKIRIIEESDIVIAVTGMIVPGKYLSTHPASPRELTEILTGLSKPIKILCGPAARFGFGLSGGRSTKEVKDVFDIIVKGDPEIVIRDFLEGEREGVDPNARRSSPSDIREFAIMGAEIVKQHPNYPNYLIAEVETYRGCTRALTGGCSFCGEPLQGLPVYRAIEDIVDEVNALYRAGLRHFRIGCQPCIFSYQARDTGREEFPRPNIDAIERLFSGIRRKNPDIKTLHIDNANPGVIARYRKECMEIAKIIVKYHTPGDVAALGVESADPKVIKENNLKAYPEDVISAIEVLNEVGAKRGRNGLPELLPGINLLFGLKGESSKTFELDYALLKEILDRGLLVRRINIRQVIPLPGTKMYEISDVLVRKHKILFKRFKRLVRETIDRPLLEKIVPTGTVLRGVYTEMYEGKTTFGRQMGSYPLLVGIPGKLMLHKFIDVKVVSHGYRSITALPYPFPINSAPREAIEALPGIGGKRAIRILRGRPFSNEEELLRTLDDESVGKAILDFGVYFG